MQADGLKSGVAEHNLQPPTGRRVALADDCEIGSDLIEHRG
jgi:hypothetical protein